MQRVSYKASATGAQGKHIQKLNILISYFMACCQHQYIMIVFVGVFALGMLIITLLLS
jgi:hypothetical protein